MSFFGGPQQWRALRKTGRLLGLTVALLAAGAAQARGDTPGVVPLSGLPAEARSVHVAILAGGPFASRKDGTVFGNREKVLPAEPRGYYHEYTVPTPGARDRGARRIVCGGAQKARPDACYYTGDHYTTFQRIVH